MAGKGDSNMKMLLSIVTAVLIAIGAPQIILAQGSSAQNVSVAVQITEARKANAALLRQYTWNSRTELIEKGEIKDTRIEFVSYGPDAQVERSPWDNQSAPLPSGFLRRAIAEKERLKIEDYLAGLRVLLDRYTLPTTGKVLDFMDQAVTTGPDAAGLIEMTGYGVVIPGDTFSIWTQAATRQTRKIQVYTFYQGDAITLTATFMTLPSGLTCLAFAEVSIPAKQLSVQVHNYDYTRIASTLQVRPASPQTVTPPSIQQREIKTQPLPPAGISPAPKVPPAGTSLHTVEQKLKDLKSLLDQGLITQSDYDAKKAQILETL
jgi:hypothetical protein